MDDNQFSVIPFYRSISVKDIILGNTILIPVVASIEGWDHIIRGMEGI